MHNSVRSPSQDKQTTYQPGITSALVDQPSGELSSGLNDQKRAEPFEKLEHRSRVSQKVIPPAEHDSLNQAILAKRPLSPAGALGIQQIAQCALNPAAVVRVDGKLAQRPDQ